MPVQVRPQAALQAFRFDEPKWPLALLERRATAELVQELLVLLEDLLVGTVLAAQEKFEGFPCCPSVPPPPQSCYLCFHITLLPSKSHHGIVHPVAVGNSFHGADVNLQGPQSFQHPRLQVSQGTGTCSGCGTYSPCSHAVHWLAGMVAGLTLFKSMGSNFLGHML